MVITSQLYIGIALGVMLSFSLQVILKGIFEREKRLSIDISYLTNLPRMNAHDLALCISQILNDPTSGHWLLNHHVDENKLATITFGYKNNGENYKRTVYCQIDDSLPHTYPLTRFSKKKQYSD